MPGGGFNAGDVYSTLAAEIDDRGFIEFDKKLSAVDKSGATASLGAEVDERGFRQFDAEVERAKRLGPIKVPVETDNRGWSDFQKRITTTNQSLGVLGKTIAFLKWPALLAALGPAAAGLSAVAGGAVALTSALAPLSGALAAYPALLSAIGQVAVVKSLAGFNTLKTAVGGLNTQLDRTTTAFKSLSPQAQHFAVTLNRLKQPIQDLQAAVQQPLFKGLNEGIQQARANLPIFQKVLVGTSTVLGHLAKRAGELFGSKGFGSDFAKVGASNNELIRRLGKAGLFLVDALDQVLVVARPLVQFMGKMAEGWARNADQAAAAGRESGKLADFFQRTERTMKRVISIASNLAGAFFNIGKAAGPLGRDILQRINIEGKKFNDWTNSKSGRDSLQQFFDSIRKPLFEFGKLLGAVGKAFFSIGNSSNGTLTQLLKSLRVDFLPVLTSLVHTLGQAFTPALISTLSSVVRLFGDLGGTSGVMTGFVKLIGLFADGLNALFQNVPGLQAIVVNFIALRGIIAGIGLAKAASDLFGFGKGLTAVKGAAAGIPAIFSRVAKTLESAKTWIGLGVSYAGDFISSLGTKLKAGGSRITAVLKNGVLAARSTISAVASAAGEIGGQVIASMAGKIKALAGRVKAVLTALIRSNAVTSGVATAAADLGGAAVGGMLGRMKAAQGRFTKIGTAIGGAFGIALRAAVVAAAALAVAEAANILRNWSDPTGSVQHAADTHVYEPPSEAHGLLDFLGVNLPSWLGGSTGGFVTDRGIQRFAMGGIARGTDSVPAMLTPGEGVLNLQAMRQIGRGGLAALNQGGVVDSPVGDQAVKDTDKRTKSIQAIVDRRLRDTAKLAKTHSETLRASVDGALAKLGVSSAKRMKLMADDTGKRTKQIRTTTDADYLKVEQSTGTHLGNAETKSKSHWGNIEADSAKHTHNVASDTESKMKDTEKSVDDHMTGAADTAKKQGDSMEGAISGSVQSSADATFQGMNYIGNAVNKALKALGVRKPVEFGLSAPGKGGSGSSSASSTTTPAKKARGGHIPGIPRGDRIPAVLEEGEYVLNARAVKKLGTKLLDRLNFQMAPRFAKGGAAATSPYVFPFPASMPWHPGTPDQRLDRGLDVTIPGTPVGAIGDGVVTNTNAGFFAGYGVGSDLIYKLDATPDPSVYSPSSPYIYLGEDIGINASGRLTAGQTLGTINSPSPGIETGWASASGLPLADELGDVPSGPYSGSGSPEAISFVKFLNDLRGGRAVTGAPLVQKILQKIVTGPPGPLRDIAQQAINRVTTAANDFLATQAPTTATVPGTPGATQTSGMMSYADFIAVALQALRLTAPDTGIPATQANADKLALLASYESGTPGNPHAGFNIAPTPPADINSAQGNPSEGLMQVTGTTFADNHEPGTSSNITDPLANIAASINYQKATYGGLTTNSPYSGGGLVGKLLRMAKGGAASGDHLGWVKVGATIDPTDGQDPPYSSHGGFSFAELLVAGANAGLRSQDLAATLGIPNGQYGMPMERAISIRMPGSKKTFKIWKNDNGSGNPNGDPHYKIDLHPAIANALGWHPNEDVMVNADPNAPAPGGNTGGGGGGGSSSTGGGGGGSASTGRWGPGTHPDFYRRNFRTAGGQTSKISESDAWNAALKIAPAGSEVFAAELENADDGFIWTIDTKVGPSSWEEIQVDPATGKAHVAVTPAQEGKPTPTEISAGFRSPAPAPPHHRPGGGGSGGGAGTGSGGGGGGHVGGTTGPHGIDIRWPLKPPRHPHHPHPPGGGGGGGTGGGEETPAPEPPPANTDFDTWLSGLVNTDGRFNAFFAAIRAGDPLAAAAAESSIFASGSLLDNPLIAAAQAWADTPDDQRPPFPFTTDWQSFIDIPFGTDVVGTAKAMFDSFLTAGWGQFQSFGAARSSLFTDFGSNFVGPGGSIPGNLKAFGAMATPGAPVAAAGGGGHTVTIHQHFATGPTDPHTWSRGTLFELQAAL